MKESRTCSVSDILLSVISHNKTSMIFSRAFQRGTMPRVGSKQTRCLRDKICKTWRIINLGTTIITARRRPMVNCIFLLCFKLYSCDMQFFYGTLFVVLRHVNYNRKGEKLQTYAVTCHPTSTKPIENTQIWGEKRKEKKIPWLLWLGVHKFTAATHNTRVTCCHTSSTVHILHRQHTDLGEKHREK